MQNKIQNYRQNKRIPWFLLRLIMYFVDFEDIRAMPFLIKIETLADGQKK